uniref:Uncharacterized protein n=1 Tax=viral metagenome TaxID=1070528 RepID=A0A6C0H716_9ZZZZ
MESNHILRETYDIDYIKKNIIDINNEIINLKKKKIITVYDLEIHIMNIYPEFYDEYPFIVKKLCKCENIDMIYMMLHELEKVEQGKDFKEIENKLANDLANKYNIKKK